MTDSAQQRCDHGLTGCGRVSTQTDYSMFWKQGESCGTQSYQFRGAERLVQHIQGSQSIQLGTCIFYNNAENYQGDAKQVGCEIRVHVALLLLDVSTRVTRFGGEKSSQEVYRRQMGLFCLQLRIRRRIYLFVSKVSLPKPTIIKNSPRLQYYKQISRLGFS